MKKKCEIDNKKVPTYKGESGDLTGDFKKSVPTLVNLFDNKELLIKEYEYCDNEYWLSGRLSGYLLGITDSGIKKNCKKGKYVTKWRTGRGGKQYLIALSSFKKNLQVKFLGLISTEISGDLYSKKKSSSDLTENQQKVISTPDIEYQLPEKQQNIAIARVKIIGAYLTFLDNSQGKKDDAKIEFEKAYNGGLPLPDIFKIIGKTSYKTIERWKVLYKKANNDYRVLAPQYKLIKGIAISEQHKQILIGFALNPNEPLISEVVRAAITKFKMLNLDHIKSENTYRRFLEKWSSENFDKWTFARLGEKALNDKCVPDIQRDYDKIAVGDIIVADGHTLNFEILNPYTGKLKRMTLIAFYDMKSNTVLGWEIQPSENILSISVALYRSILRLGKYPKVIYLDNGRAFSSKYFNGEKYEDSTLPGLFSRMKIKVIFAQAYHAQSKTIERFFGTFAELERRLPTYTGTSIAKKPPRMNRGEKIHTKVYQKLTKNITIDIWAAHSAIADWLDEYIKRPQQGHLKGQAPIDLFLPGMGTGIDKHELTFLMMKTEIKKIYKNGILFQNNYYWNEALYGLRTEGVFKTEIRFDLVDNDSIFVYTKEGDFICEAKKSVKNHAAAGILGTQEDVKKLNEALKIKGILVKSTTGSAKEFLNTEMLPAINKQVTEAKILQLKAEDDVKIPNKKDKKSTSIFDDMDDIELPENKKRESFFG